MKTNYYVWPAGSPAPIPQGTITADKDGLLKALSKQGGFLPVLISIALLLGGCVTGSGDRLKDALASVNRDAYAGKLDCSIRYAAPGTMVDAGRYDRAANRIVLHPDWCWEPDVYLKGIVAHEAIHASGVRGHWVDFEAERIRVAQACDMYESDIPKDGEETRIDVTRDVKRMDRELKAFGPHGLPERGWIEADWRNGTW